MIMGLAAKAEASGEGDIHDQARWEFWDDQLVRFAMWVAAHEREECAKICDHGVAWYPLGASPTVIKETCAVLARAIRRRGE
jgi:hypothetical protein